MIIELGAVLLYLEADAASKAVMIRSYQVL